MKSQPIAPNMGQAEAELTFPDNDALVAEHVKLKVRLEATQLAIYEVEKELLRRLEMDEATELVTNTHKAKITQKVIYDYTILGGMFELVPQTELIEAGAFTPAHQVTTDVMAKWNITHLARFKKRGKDVRDMIDRARKPGRPRLTVAPL
jgi:hypothetical protein